MPIKFNCHKCGANLRVPEQHIGKKARCPKCDEKCIVPEKSQRSSSKSNLGGNFEDIGNVLEAPVGLPPAPLPPLATPLPPAMAAPVAPLPSSIPKAASPYSPPAASPRKSSGAAISGNIMQPLYEARGMMKIWGWMTFIIGILYCITIFGAIVGWVFVWMGWLVKGAAESVTIGIETGNKQELRLANERIGTFFKILGVFAIIGLVIMGLYVVLAMVAIVLTIVSASAA